VRVDRSSRQMGQELRSACSTSTAACGRAGGQGEPSGQAPAAEGGHHGKLVLHLRPCAARADSKAFAQHGMVGPSGAGAKLLDY